MAVDVETKPMFHTSRPRMLFERPFVGGVAYDVDSDGSVFS